VCTGSLSQNRYKRSIPEMAKPDPFLNLLKDIGFLPMRLPRTDVEPLTVVSKNGKDLNLLGQLASAMVAGVVALPPIASDIQTAGQIQGTKTSKIKFSIGVDILGSIIQALTGEKLNVSVGFNNASTLTFEFADVTVDKVDI